jgi:hypothetical protein
MAVRTLEKQEWHRYFDRISRGLLGKRAEIEAASLELGDQIEAEWVPLLGITYDQKTGVSREWGIMPRRPTARSGLHGAETGDPSPSRAFHCRPRNEPEAGDRCLFGTSASAVICSFAD